MSAYNCKRGFIEERFMCGRGRGFNLSLALKEFVNATRKQYTELTILPLHEDGNTICNGMDVPGSREGIDRYYRHEVKANSVNDKIRIRAYMALGALKKQKYPFCNYVDDNHVYINNAQLGDEEGMTIGWLFKAHPAFGFREDTKERFNSMMDEEIKNMKYAILPNIIKYKRTKNGGTMTTTGMTLHVAKVVGIYATEFCANMAEKWQNLTAKTGGNLYDKTLACPMRSTWTWKSLASHCAMYYTTTKNPMVINSLTQSKIGIMEEFTGYCLTAPKWRRQTTS
jgi:hypothetical protein